ncbi:MAG: Rne/Rng family ribonuclease [Myxococcales bacterium]|nr:Rne/Rng family ribonuclease [Myxococcales bacterium]
MARNLLVINVALRETRVALIEDGVIAELQIERARARNTVGNIVLGKVTRVLPGMQAAFIDVGMERAAFLHVEDLIRPDDFEEYLAGAAHALERKSDLEAKSGDDEVIASSDDDSSDDDSGDDGDSGQRRRRRGRGKQRARAAKRVEEADRGDEVDQDDEDDRADDYDSDDRDEDDEDDRADDYEATAESDEDDESDDESEEDEESEDDDESEEDEESEDDDESDEDEDESYEDEPSDEAGSDEEDEDDESEEDEESEDDDESDEDEESEDDDESDEDEDDESDEDEDDESEEDEDDEGDHHAAVDADDETDQDDEDDRADDEDLQSSTSVVDEDGDVIRVRRRAAPPASADSEDGWPDAEADTLLAGEALRDSGDDESSRDEAQSDGNRDGRRRRRRRGRRRKNGGDSNGEKQSTPQEQRANRTESKQERSRRGRDKRRRGRDSERDSKRDSKRNDAKDSKNRKATSLRVSRSVPITEVVKEGNEVIVQISKEPIGTKGARVTSHVSLPGRHVVYLPTVDHIGISKRIGSFRERQRLRKAIESVKPPTGGLIVRTVAEGLTKKHLKEDIGYLLKLWAEVAKNRENAKAPAVLYEELDLVLKVARDLFTDEIEKIVIDDKEEYTRLVRFVEMFMPNRVKDVELYSGTDPIFDAYGIEDEIARALSRKVPLPSGGYLILDQAEALTAIDVNTGRYVGKGSKDLEETALKTNLEAVDEIAYQLRFRNIGGLVILDLIDMENPKNRDKVWRALEQRLEKDKAKTTLNRISELGLIEMTRKRTRESLGRTMHEPCFYCDGTGQIMSRTTIAYEILRQVRRELRSLPGYSVHVNAHPAIVDLLKTEEKDAVIEAERRYMRRIEFTPRREYHIEQFDLTGK